MRWVSGLQCLGPVLAPSQLSPASQHTGGCPSHTPCITPSLTRAPSSPFPPGAINFTGDHPVVLTVDGPSLGGFVCPATITSTEVGSCWTKDPVQPAAVE